MKKLLNTLYVTTQGAYLAKEGETVKVWVEKEARLQLPIHTLSAIICFGQVSASPALMGLCGERNVALSFMTEYGRFLARVQGPVSGNVLLRRAQYRQADVELFSAELARVIVAAKVVNCRHVLQRALRDYPDGEDVRSLEQASNYLKRLLKKLQIAEPLLDTIRGWEGDAAHSYFSAFNALIRSDQEEFSFQGRNRRPPLDNMNALLSFIYTLVAHDMKAALEGVGLDPAVGYLHRDRPGRAGLALDLMEELRAYLGDRLALSLVNRRQLKAKGFKKTESGAVMMDDESRKTVLIAYQERKRDTITHPFLNEKVEVGLLPHVQSMLFARYLRGELDSYPPFVSR
jgi:CRISP-associated protein Cas1